jgi:hypothetical protein
VNNHLVVVGSSWLRDPERKRLREGDRKLRVGEVTSIRDLNSPESIRFSFLFCDLSYFPMTECFSTSWASALVFSNSNSQLSDASFFSKALNSV